MASTYKTELGFNQWLDSDKPRMEDFNKDNLLVDEKLRQLIAEKVNNLKMLPVKIPTQMENFRSSYFLVIDKLLVIQLNLKNIDNSPLVNGQVVCSLPDGIIVNGAPQFGAVGSAFSIASYRAGSVHIAGNNLVLEIFDTDATHLTVNATVLLA